MMEIRRGQQVLDLHPPHTHTPFFLTIVDYPWGVLPVTLASCCLTGSSAHSNIVRNVALRSSDLCQALSDICD